MPRQTAGWIKYREAWISSGWRLHARQSPRHIFLTTFQEIGPRTRDRAKRGPGGLNASVCVLHSAGAVSSSGSLLRVGHVRNLSRISDGSVVDSSTPRVPSEWVPSAAIKFTPRAQANAASRVRRCLWRASWRRSYSPPGNAVVQLPLALPRLSHPLPGILKHGVSQHSARGWPGGLAALGLLDDCLHHGWRLDVEQVEDQDGEIDERAGGPNMVLGKSLGDLALVDCHGGRTPEPRAGFLRTSGRF
jgi:hypothetical protein